MRKEITAGWLLAKSRSDKKITLEEVNNKTYLSEDAILALEKNNLGFFSSRINAEGLAKKYAAYLGQDTEYIASLVRRDYLINSPDSFPSYNIYASKKGKKFDVWWWSGIIIVFLTIVFFGYLCICYRQK